MKRTLVSAAVLAAAAATPAAAYEPPNAVNADPYFVITTSKASGANRLDATCYIYADRLTRDYGPTQVSGIATTAAVGPTTSITCSLYYADRAGGVSASGGGDNVARVDARKGTVGTWGLEICVSATSSWDGGSLSAADCQKL